MFGLSAPPKRMECFDVSHTMGERTVASCVVFGPEGPLKSDYRRFNIEGLAPGDDYGAMRQALSRRYARIKKGEAPMPDLLLIDGGPGQLAEAISVLEGAGDRRRLRRRRRQGRRPPAGAGTPVPRRAKSMPRVLPPDSPALHLIQRIRDEAHRFAITGHRAAPGQGAHRTRCWRRCRGSGRASAGSCCGSSAGCRASARAGIDDLAKVHGISRKLAQSIYDTLHATG